MRSSFAGGQALTDGDWAEDAENGTTYATEVRQTMRGEDHLFLAANMLELAGQLVDPEPERPIRDCTTLPCRGKKQRTEYEQSM